jgi:hypothetical protein
MTQKISQHHKKTRMIAVGALIAGVAGLGVAFAALSTTLLINGTAKIKSANWDIHWAGLSCTPSGEAAVVTAGTNLSKTTSDNDTVNVSAEFKTAGDKVVCTMNAVNSGTLDAVLSGYGSSLAALNDIEVTAALTVSGTTPVDGRALNAGASDPYTLTLTYTGATVGTDSAAKNFTYTIPYVQANQ